MRKLLVFLSIRWVQDRTIIIRGDDWVIYHRPSTLWGWVRMRILRAIPTCTLWEYQYFRESWIFRPWRSIEIAHRRVEDGC